MHFLPCKRFSKSLKTIEKTCKEKLEEVIMKEIASLMQLKPHLPSCCVPLFSFGDFKLYKLRVKSCGKGKSGGLRVIFGHDENKDLVLLIQVYRKSQKENMIKAEIVEEILDCLQNP